MRAFPSLLEKRDVQYMCVVEHSPSGVLFSSWRLCGSVLEMREWGWWPFLALIASAV
jgi:hypothetical protein